MIKGKILKINCFGRHISIPPMTHSYFLVVTILAIAFWNFITISYSITSDINSIGATNFIVSSQGKDNVDSKWHTDSDTSLNEMTNRTNQVFITMPDKAAGTTLMHFAFVCSNRSKMKGDTLNNQERIEKVFTDNFQLPSIIASHVPSDRQFIDMLKGSTRETLIIYIHREELSRVRSAVQHILMSRVCTHDEHGAKLMNRYHFDVELNGSRCTIDEEHVITIIKNRNLEIGVGAPEILTCEYFDAIAQNTPSNLVFIHYKQANKLQEILSKYHCPHVMKDLPFTMNDASKKIIEPFIRLKTNKSKIVTFEEWFDKKQSLILWALNSNSKMNCKSKILDMEDHLFSCPDESVALFQDKFQCVSLY